ncbi:LPXTG cell wall anchor domain-containing protein [Nesterenkonia ebinurensis]|uniref:LPXTG cell wall anchor domain-containing protein n=1 Tax=Nesterenkonia ebinurensis TaxID=2608252 RepID=UPI00123D1348|nr:LPXTG cell wall anchor domain-containing protein [Nesterenkonia ebinurensis]
MSTAEICVLEVASTPGDGAGSALPDTGTDLTVLLVLAGVLVILGLIVVRRIPGTRSPEGSGRGGGAAVLAVAVLSLGLFAPSTPAAASEGSPSDEDCRLIEIEGITIDLEAGDDLIPGDSRSALSFTVHNSVDFPIELSIGSEVVQDGDGLARWILTDLTAGARSVQESLGAGPALAPQTLEPGESAVVDYVLKLDPTAGNDTQGAELAFVSIIDVRQS